MASWDSGPDSDEEPINLHLFNRKVVGFIGLEEDKENTLKKIAQQLGASCEDVPKPYTSKVFTTPEYYDTLMEYMGPMYNVTFIRDCVDANKYLNIEEYRFGPNYLQKTDYPDFEPCCQNFHSNEKPCLVCDPTPKVPDPAVKQRNKPKSIQSIGANDASNNKKPKPKSASTNESGKTRVWSNGRQPWAPSESRLMLDYIICNNLIFTCKSPSLFRRMISEGFLTHRTADALRRHFRINILQNIDSFDLPKTTLKQFKQVRNAGRIAGKNMAFKQPSIFDKQVIKNTIKKRQHVTNNPTS